MNFKLIVMDVDGTLTDGKLYMSAQGEAFKVFDIKDGCAIKQILPNLGIKSAIITGRYSEIVKLRAEELDVDYVYQGVTDKKQCLIEIAEKMGIALDNIIYVGDDINDIEAIKAVGLGCCVANGMPEVKAVAKYVTAMPGGSGAIRDVIEKIANEFNLNY